LSLACVVASTLVFRHWVLSSIMLLAGAVLLGWGVSVALRYDTAAAMISITVPAAVQVVVLGAVRLAGYRFMRSPAGAGPSENAGSQ